MWVYNECEFIIKSWGVDILVFKEWNVSINNE